MFICKSCLPESQKWLADLRMGVSHGACEYCGYITGCVDYHGNLEELQPSAHSDHDIDRYCKKE